MPQVHDGIGTWYYGKRNIFARKGVCEFCHAVTNLTSYDTTLFFVVFFVPLIPLSRKRILDQCGQCKKHRVLKLAEWEKQKASVFDDLTDTLKKGSDARGAIVEALGAASGFQDQKLFDQIAPVAAAQNDAIVQLELGGGYAHFSRWNEAEEAIRKSLTLNDQPETRERLASVLLKLDRPDEARPFAQHALNSKDPEKSWLIFLLIESYQSLGRHDDALALMDARDAAFPTLAADKDCQKQRQLSVKYAASGKPVPSQFLSTGRKTGYSEGSAWRSKAARIIGPMIAVGLLAAYLISAWYKGEHRKVYLVNGSNRPYACLVNNKRVQLTPNIGTPIEIEEGPITITSDQVDLGPGPLQCQVETSFFSRPFASHTFVINPDRLAVIVWEETEFADQPTGQVRPAEFHTGELLHSFSGIDYEFAAFPAQIKAKRGSRIMKQRISAETPVPTESRIRRVGLQLPAERQIEYARQMLRLDPNDGIALGWLAALLPPAAMLEEVRPHLDIRPPQVEWHRMYQTFSEMVDHKTDLRPEYRRLVEETNRSSDSLYLLARIETEPEAEKIYQEAIAAKPPSVNALSGIGFRRLARGQFAEAVGHFAKARQLQPNDSRIVRLYRESLVAAEQFDKLASDLTQTEDFATRWADFRYHLIALVGQNKNDEAQQLAQQFPFTLGLNANTVEFEQVKQLVDQLMVTVLRDREAFLKHAESKQQLQSIDVSVLLDKPREAAAKIPSGDDHPGRTERRDAIQNRALIYLSAMNNNESEVAKEQFDALIKVLANDDRDHRYVAAVLSGEKPFDWETVRMLVIDPETKRVLLPVLAQRFPDQADNLKRLTRQLNYQRDDVSLCLRHLLKE